MRKANTNPIPEGTFVYYIRESNREKTIVGTVAFRPNVDGTINRGVAVTGLGESGGRRVGRKIALNRLEIAEQEGESSRPINFRRGACARFALNFEGSEVETFKCACGVNPTEFEERICTSAVT